LVFCQQICQQEQQLRTIHGVARFLYVPLPFPLSMRALRMFAELCWLRLVMLERVRKGPHTGTAGGSAGSTQQEGTMQTTKVGIREFRENLADYLESKTPVAITRHGATIGIYVPTKPKPSQADLEALRIAGEKMQELIAAAGTSEDKIVADFKKLRRERRAQKKS
jgi:hypothetical protein